MISNYSELKAALYKWLVKDNTDPFFDSDMMDNIIFMAETELNRRMRVRQMRDTASVSITAGDNSSSLPTDFIEMYSVWLNSPVQEVQSASAGVFSRGNYYLTQGSPELFYLDSDTIVFGPIPDSDYTATVDYYKKISALSDSNTTNAILTDFPDIYLFTSLKHAYIAAQDVEREGVYEQRAAMLIAEANAKDKKASFAKGSRGIARSII